MSMFREVFIRQCGEPPSSVQGHAHTIGWSCEGWLAAGSTGGWLVLYDLDSTSVARVKSSFAISAKDSVECLEWHPSDRNQLATCFTDRTMKLWDVRSPGAPAQTYTSDGENFSVTYSPDGHYIAMGSVRKDRGVDTDILGIYDLRTKKKLKSVKFNVMVNDYMWSPNGEYIINSCEKGRIDIMAFGGTKPLSRVKSMTTAHASGCQGMDIDPLHRYMACGGIDGLVSLWELEDFICVRTIERFDVAIRSLSFSPDGRFLAISMLDKPTDIAEVESGARAHVIDSGGGSSCVKFHPKRPILASISARPSRGDFGLRMHSFHY